MGTIHPIKAACMKCAAVFVVVFLALGAEGFSVLRPRFPVKATPPFSGDTGVIGDDILKNSPKETSVPAPR
jgi:hypothetical protein